MAFIFIGQVNVLAPIVTINFMLTYSFIDYSYFIVAMTFQLQTKERDPPLVAKGDQRRSSGQSTRPLIEDALPKYGSVGESLQTKGTLLEFTQDMNQIFPAVSNIDGGAENVGSVSEPSSRCKSRAATAKQKLMDSFGLDLNSNMFSEEKAEEHGSAPPYEEAEGKRGSTELGVRGEQVKSYTNTGRDSCADPQSHSRCAGDEALVELTGISGTCFINPAL